MSWSDKVNNQQPSQQDLLNLIDKLNNENELLNQENQSLNQENEQLQNQVKVLTVLQEQLVELDKRLEQWQIISTNKAAENNDLETALQALDKHLSTLQTKLND